MHRLNVCFIVFYPDKIAQHLWRPALYTSGSKNKKGKPASPLSLNSLLFQIPLYGQPKGFRYKGISLEGVNYFLLQTLDRDLIYLILTSLDTYSCNMLLPPNLAKVEIKPSSLKNRWVHEKNIFWVIESTFPCPSSLGGQVQREMGGRGSRSRRGELGWYVEFPFYLSSVSEGLANPF